MLLCHEVAAQQTAIGTVIWLHGLGASGDDFSPIIPHMQLPDVRFILPHAPLRAITIDGGYRMPAWYDIRTLEDSPRRESHADIVDSANLISELIEREIERGIPSERIMLCGFSQGGAMALYLAHRYPKRLLGAVIMSGYIVHEDTFEHQASPTNATLPMLFCHGERDLVVSVEKGFHAYHQCQENHEYIQWKEFPVGHEICLEELRYIRSWMHQRFAAVRQQLAQHNGPIIGNAANTVIAESDE